ncbi:MAG: hypothetical protein GY810_04840 [Aureispira sp.]|nr:hypothetical protein [Aureispira sp.]
MSKIFEDDNHSKGSQYVQLSVVMVVLAVVAYLVIKFVMGFVWWILGVLGILVLIINRKFVWKVIKSIQALYKKNTWMGVGATLGGFLALTPFMGFLFLKTIWDFRNSDFLPTKKGKDKKGNTTVDADATIIDIDPVEIPKDTDWNTDIDKLPPSGFSQ